MSNRVKSFEPVIFLINEIVLTCKRISDVTDLAKAIFPLIETRFNSKYINLVNMIANKTQCIVIVENLYIPN